MDVPLGSQDVIVWAPGCGYWTRAVEIAAGRESSVVVDLLPGVALRGTVRGADGKPNGHASVRLGGNGVVRRPGDLRTSTRADGSHAFDDLAAGELKLSIYAPDGGDAATKIDARPGDTLTWDVTLGPTRALESRVVDARGQGLAARLEARSRDTSGMLREGSSDAKGHFRLAGLPDAPAEVRVSLGDATVARVASARLGRGELVITVPDADLPSAFITGTVLGADGALLGQAQVCAARHDRPDLRAGPWP